MSNRYTACITPFQVRPSRQLVKELDRPFPKHGVFFGGPVFKLGRVRTFVEENCQETGSLPPQPGIGFCWLKVCYGDASIQLQLDFCSYT